MTTRDAIFTCPSLIEVEAKEETVAVNEER